VQVPILAHIIHGEPDLQMCHCTNSISLEFPNA
jgi:peptide methionine sulfoxide reductase MsrB